jgi:hypothetical protein
MQGHEACTCKPTSTWMTARTRSPRGLYIGKYPPGGGEWRGNISRCHLGGKKFEKGKRIRGQCKKRKNGERKRKKGEIKRKKGERKGKKKEERGKTEERGKKKEERGKKKEERGKKKEETGKKMRKGEEVKG